MCRSGKTPLKGDALVNKVAMIIIEIICCALIFGYISDYMAGYADKGYFIVCEVVSIVTAIGVPVAYKLSPNNLKYVAFINFTLVYAVAMFKTVMDITFVIAFPIVIVFVLYYDFKLMCIMASTFGVITLLDCVNIVAINKAHHSGLAVNSSMLLLEVLGMGIFLVAAVIVTRISKRNNDEKIGEIQGFANRITDSIKEINIEIGQLNESSEAAKLAMVEINKGISDTADAVQNQLSQTEAIQDRIENVKQVADKIDENVGITMDSVETGNNDVNSLVKQADRSVEISDKVLTDLNGLKESMDAMGGITRMIESIAFQTNIMALNANVEAARAGEAGRGFAVVATEISNMSTQTKDATDNITDLINNATTSLDDLVRSVDEMAEVIRSEKEQTTQTSEVFSSIQSSTEEVKENVNLFMDYITGLTEANGEIVRSVSTISAATQQVSALASEALAKEQDNAGSVSEIATQIGRLAN